jgi:hypothetical protein
MPKWIPLGWLLTQLGFGPAKSGRTQVSPGGGLTASGSTKPTFLVGAIEHLPGWVTVH